MKWRNRFSRRLVLVLLIAQDGFPFRSFDPVGASILQGNSPCQSHLINDHEGIITSPNYPSMYPGRVRCKWKLRSPPNTMLNINVIDLDIPEDKYCKSPPCCSKHRLSIIQENEKTVLCGNNTSQRSFIIYNSVTQIIYYSSKNDCCRGFKLAYSIDRNFCKPNQLACMDGRCHSKSVFCSGFNICRDGYDEAYCKHIANVENYEAVKREILLHEYRVLNFPVMKYLWSCKDGSLRCPLSPGRCFFPSTDICNGKFDCPKGEDESGCKPNCPRKVACSNGKGCYHPAHRCDGVRNCEDSSDELSCSTSSCMPMEFTCLNGACIMGSGVCNGINDCGDNSDELNCPMILALKMITLGLLICLILCGVVICHLYKGHSSRLQSVTNSLRDSESGSSDDRCFREPPPSYSAAVNDDRMLPYPSSSLAEGYFEREEAARMEASRSIRRHRRRRHTDEDGPSSSNQNDPKSSDNEKEYEMDDRTEFQRHLEMHGFVSSLDDYDDDDDVFNITLNDDSYSTRSRGSQGSRTSCSSFDGEDQAASYSD